MNYKFSHWLPALIANSNIYESFSDKKDKVILDLGCRTPRDVFQLYHHFPNFRKFYAVDNNSHFDEEGNSKMDNMLKGFQNIYEYYQSFNFTNPLTKDELEEIFNINLSVSAEAFLENTDAEFDLIILSNFLHMYVDKEAAIRTCKSAISRLKANGLIYISIASENHEYTESVMRTTYTEDEILDLVFGLKEIVFLRKHSHYQCLFSK